MEDLLKLESDDTIASRDAASKVQSQLKSARDPQLLGELVEFYFTTYSRRARKILTTLRETHSQVSQPLNLLHNTSLLITLLAQQESPVGDGASV